MSFLLDNSVSNSTAWRLSISENVSRLKFGAHAVHLTLSQDAPTFRARPQIGDVNIHGSYEYEHTPVPVVPIAPDDSALDLASLQPITQLVGIPGRLTICGQTFFRQDTAAQS